MLRLDDAIQSGLQNKTTTLAGVVGQAQPFDLRVRRNVADFKLTYSATQHLDFNLAFKNTTKNGNQPWAGTFGFSDAVELAVPVDTRTTDLGAALEWASSRGSVRLGYDGSFFRNNISTLVWDNPLRVTDSPTLGPLQGRMSLWPDSNMSAGSVMGLLNLPARSRATAYISVGNWSQNDPLIPFTINSSAAGDSARSRDGRRAGARHEHELQLQLAADRHRVVHGALPLVRLRQPDAGVPRRQHRVVRHDGRGVCRGRHEPLQPHAPHLRRRGVADARQIQRVPRRLHARADLADVSVPSTRRPRTRCVCPPTRRA